MSNFYKKWKETETRADNFINNSKLQSASGDYAGAWNMLEQAIALKPTAQNVQSAQADLVMIWLRNMRLHGAKNETSSSEIVDKLLPVLCFKVNNSKGQAKADVLAHTGWANYLKFRDGIRDIKVAENFKTAIAEDSLNVFAHAMWGFWILYPGSGQSNIDEAENHFNKALKSGREQVYARHLQLSALRNCDNDYSQEPKIFMVINDMRKNGDTLGEDERSSILSNAYYFNKGLIEKIDSAISPKEHLETFLYLKSGIDMTERPYLQYANALLLEKTGDLSIALSMYEAIYSNSAFKYYTKREDVKKAIDRLSANKSK